MKTTRILLWISYIGFVLSVIIIGFLGIMLLRDDFNSQEIEKGSLEGVVSKSTTAKLKLPMNLNLEYYFRIDNGEILIDSYFLKIQKKFLTNSLPQLASTKDNDFPRQLEGNLYSMPDSDSYQYISIPYGNIKASITIVKLYSFLISTILLLSIFFAIRFLQNCDKGHFFIPSNTTYLRMISYLAIAYTLVSYGIQWIIFKTLNNNLNDLASIDVNSGLEFNWTFLIASLFLLLITQAFAEGIKLKEEQSLTI